jgi:hypothetical protein
LAPAFRPLRDIDDRNYHYRLAAAQRTCARDLYHELVLYTEHEWPYVAKEAVCPERYRDHIFEHFFEALKADPKLPSDSQFRRIVRGYIAGDDHDG